MQHVPANVHQTAIWPVSLQNQPGSRSISDDNLCSWCRHLCYRPGELSLCQQTDSDGIWPSQYDVDGYAQSCPQLHLHLTPADITCR
ncbi:hypothetical protein VC623_16515 [Citrobacter amalonaticus]|uniref:hypothetical protein n=1 Tax=Citrobacter amalonaticus TaxID=35703 RepID=UPI00292BF837|nr:hypothetical protein [Citrobacter amalonaticus]MDV0786221.1 hypothetical protein [Citrobacter amalonaticus]MEB0642284.1 hypothetical protein [Citrobacter amalonaticus]HCD7970629.1 hypothetical protein [Citrobacter amalonaticus]